MRKKRVGLLAMVVAILLGSFAIGATAAKFLSEWKGAGSISVAQWDVTAKFTGESTDFILADREGERTAEYPFTVTSKSQVALSYDVVITLPTALPNSAIIAFAIKDNDSKPKVSGNVYTFSDVGTFTAQGGTNEHILIITATDFWYAINQEGVEVEIVAEQVDPTGN